METKEQPIQNHEEGTTPVSNEEQKSSENLKVDDEKDPSNKDDVPSLQISDQEKADIINLIQGKKLEIVTVTTDINVELPESNKLLENQINESDKAEIINLIQGEKTQVVADEPVVKDELAQDDAKGDGKQISVSEKENIVNLLRGNIEKSSSKKSFDNIDFESLNKQELVHALEEVVEEQDISIIKSKVAKISTSFYKHNKEDKQNELSAFVASGGKEEEFSHVEDEFEIRFNKAIGAYRHNKAKFTQNLEAQKQTNLILKHALLEDLKELIASEETLKKTYDEFKKLQEKWKEIGMIPATELRNLWQSYHFLVEKFFDKVRINRELRDLDLKKNLEAKIALCEKAEELIVEKSIIKSFKLLQFYHDKWREIGPVPADVKDDVWERFRGITDKINIRRKEHYKELQEEQEVNYEAKKVLCEKAKEAVEQSVESLKGWQKSTDKVNELLRVWKTIGRAPKAKNDEIWANFKGSLDKFFKAKRDHLSEIKEQQVNNYNLKLDLCVKAESVKESTDWGSTTRELIGYQKEWKSTGPVPRKYSDKVWKRFRAACDSFFNRKSEHFKNIHGVEDANLKSKRELVSNINNFKVGDDKNANLTALKDFQKLWMEIGFVPFKEKDKIQNEYRAAIDQLLEKMDVNKSELSVSDYKDKMEILKSGPDADIRLSKERAFVSAKIRKIKEDLDIWENNIGFFSSSKQSSKLVEDFEHKIEKAKSEIENLKSRLRLIN
ncbi:MAG: DUF349 domain-containing protein [Bacteroidota bacterium]